MQKTKIDWGVGQLWTWNPVVGCVRDCSYFYAKKIRQRFSKIPFNSMTYYSKRLTEPLNHKKPATIFVGSMSDIEYWISTYMNDVLQVCRQCPQHTFMFLSESPDSYHGFDWPPNTMQGLTITAISKGKTEGNLFSMNFLPRPFLSLEPLLGLTEYRLNVDKLERVIVGAMTGAGSIKPKPEWIQSIKDNIPKEKIFWKKSIKEFA